MAKHMRTPQPRWTGTFSLSFEIELAAPDAEEAAQRISDVMTCLVNRQPSGEPFRSRVEGGPHHFLGRPLVHCTGATGNRPVEKDPPPVTMEETAA